MDDQPQVLTVSQLTLQIKAKLETSFPAVWILGEVSDISRPRSGHIYLGLKDEQAQIRAVIWRSTASRLKFEIEDGMQVICGGSLDVYPPRGSYQLVIRQVEPQGLGALQLALQQLQKKLEGEGLFAASRKRSLPRFPRRIGFVTSPSGAAIRDFLQVQRRRWTGVDVFVFPVRVQGDQAATEIAAGIELANRMRPRLDVLVVGRGGGSVEDLWCFNEEQVVRAIAGSELPTVSAVGHEIDVTLADLAADLRALTPSEAAELVVPSGDELAGGVRGLGVRLQNALQSRARQARLRLEALEQRSVLQRPLQPIEQAARRTDELEFRLTRALEGRQTRWAHGLARLAGRLESLSPLGVLGRGYSVTRKLDSETALREAGQTQVGDLLETRLAQGRLTSRVESIAEDTNHGRSD